MDNRVVLSIVSALLFTLLAAPASAGVALPPNATSYYCDVSDCAKGGDGNFSTYTGLGSSPEIIWSYIYDFPDGLGNGMTFSAYVSIDSFGENDWLDFYCTNGTGSVNLLYRHSIESGDSPLFTNNATIPDECLVDNKVNISIGGMTGFNMGMSDMAFFEEPDTTAPVVTIHLPQNTTYRDDENIIFNVTTSELADSIGISVNGGEILWLCTNASICEGFAAPQDAGYYEWAFYANDSVNNTGSASVMFTVIETQAPLLTIYVPQNTTYDALNTTLQVSANETIDSWWYSLNGGANVSFAPNTTFMSVEGVNNLTVYANDTVGNIGSALVYFTVALPVAVTTGVQGLLTDAGSGLGNFLDFITTPTVNIIMGLGMIGGVLAVVYGLAMVIGRAVGGSVKSISR